MSLAVQPHLQCLYLKSRNPASNFHTSFRSARADPQCLKLLKHTLPSYKRSNRSPASGLNAPIHPKVHWKTDIRHCFREKTVLEFSF